MIKKDKYPILEFDDTKESIISPELFAKHHNISFPEKLVITFFSEAIKRLLEEKVIEFYDVIHGENEITLYKFVDTEILLMQGIIGCPATGGFLDELIGCGVKKVMFCGGGGVLDKEITVGKLLIVTGAIRDEGFSYHYLAPSRIVYADERIVDIIVNYLEKWEIDYIKGITWTTDAFYRETKDLVKYRRAEGALIVEMEQAACLAVSQYRNIEYGGIIYGGDDVSGVKWDNRNWHSREEIRYSLVRICKELVELF